MSEFKRYTCVATTTVTQTRETYARSAEDAAKNFAKHECAITSHDFGEWEITDVKEHSDG